MKKVLLANLIILAGMKDLRAHDTLKVQSPRFVAFKTNLVLLPNICVEAALNKKHGVWLEVNHFSKNHSPFFSNAFYPAFVSNFLAGFNWYPHANRRYLHGYYLGAYLKYATSVIIYHAPDYSRTLEEYPCNKNNVATGLSCGWQFSGMKGLLLHAGFGFGASFLVKEDHDKMIPTSYYRPLDPDFRLLTSIGYMF